MLCGICLILLGIRIIYPYFITPDKIITATLPSINSDSTKPIKQDERSFERKSGITVKLHAFDPNQAGFEKLCSLGFSEKTAKVLIKFRGKGFVFRKKDDLKKVYGVDETLYNKLSPYISIAEKSELSDTPKTTETKNVKGNIIELNSADSTALTTLSGIGPAFAKRILKYRELLGGFSNKEQLREVYGLNEELYEKIKANVSVNASLIRKLDLNEEDFKAINKHPYLSYEITKAIFNQRRNIPITPEVLKEILQDEEVFNKLKIYIEY